MEYFFVDDPLHMDWERALILNGQSDLCIALNAMRENLDKNYIDAFTEGDVVHAGLLFFDPEAFQALSLAPFSWLFLQPLTTRPSNSWMATFHVLVIRRGVLPQLQIFKSYTNTHFSASDLSFQVLKRGGMVMFNPSLLINPAVSLRTSRVPKSDLRRFILRFLDKRAALVTYPVDFFQILNQRTSKGVTKTPLINSRLISQQRQKSILHYAAVVPTINRYPYLKKAIYSLLNKTNPPIEIIVVDQSPEALRPKEYYDEFDKRVVKVFFLDQAGQSTARNYAIQQVSVDWILFFDDDSEAWEDMIDEHIRVLQYSRADVSTGVSLAPWKDRSYIPDSINFYHIASVLDTGNCMMAKTLVQNVGLFDPAFDKGSGADDNLGKRLYIMGALIVFNPKAIRTHHKAAQGGLREYGAWWKNKGTYFGPFPLATESYDFLSFYPRAYFWRLCVTRLLTSYRRSGITMNVMNTLLFPIKVIASYRKARRLMNQ